MGDQTPQIDNRYSAIYQRGGTGAKAVRTNAPASPGAAQQNHPDTPPTGSAQPVRPSAEAPANVVEVLPEGVAPSERVAGSGGARINPFVLFLWVLGAGLLALGLWAVFAPLQVEETAINGPFPQWVYIISQSAGGIVVSGSILLAAAGALSALSWDGSRRK